MATGIVKGQNKKSSYAGCLTVDLDDLVALVQQAKGHDLEALKREGWHTCADVALKSNFSKTTARCLLTGLIKTGRVEVKKVSSNLYYRVKPAVQIAINSSRGSGIMNSDR